MDRVGEEADEDTIDKIARSEAVHDNTAGSEAARDKSAEEGKAILKATERVEEFTVDPSIEAIQTVMHSIV